MSSKVRFLFCIAVLAALAFAIGPANAQEPAASPEVAACLPGALYDPACDADHDGDVDIYDIQLTAGHWNQSGTWISDNSHHHLGQTWEGSNNALKLTGAYGWPDYAALVLSNSTGDGLEVSSAGNTGVFVGSANFDGMSVYSAGNTGVYVNSTGDDGMHIQSAGDDGVNVQSAGADGLRVGTAGGEGVAVESATFNGVYVGAAGANGVYVNSASDDGVAVTSADGAGVRVGSAGQSGVYVGAANSSGIYVGQGYLNGVYVNSVGNPSASYFAPYKSGFQVAGSQGYGLWVGRADRDGVKVFSANEDGFDILSAGDDGIQASGNNYSGYFNGDIAVGGNCVGCLLAMFGVNVSERALMPGDVVAVAGLRETDIDTGPVLAEVIPTGTGQQFVGVVSGRAELVMDADPFPDETGRRLVMRKGAAAPGDYVTIVYSGPMQVRLAADVPAIAAGARVTAGADGGVRPLQTRTVDGMVVAEGAPVLGVALGEAANGLVWVLVNPQ